MDRVPRTDQRAAERHARVAVAALFFTNGAVFANLLPRYPQIKADLDVDNTAYGLAVAAFPAGAIVAGLAAGMLVRRFGSANVAVAGTALTSVLVLAAAVAPALALFVMALFVAGAMDAITDVAQNSHGLQVQRRYGRSIINSFHATWSIGAVTGGLMSAGAIAIGLPRGVHLGVSAGLFTTVALTASRFCLPTDDTALQPATTVAITTADTTADDVTAASAPTDEPDRPPSRVGRRRRTALIIATLVGIAIAGAVVEDAGSSWAAVYLSGDLGASAAFAASGYVALVGAQFVGRLLGDRLVDRFGERAVARTGGLITATGMALALGWQTIPTTVIGFGAAGFGVATLVPSAMHHADQLPDLAPGLGLTLVSWLMRLGFLLSPPIVGLVADRAGLRAGLLVVVAAGVAVVALAGVLCARPRSRGNEPQNERSLDPLRSC